MVCANCLRFSKCVREWKGTPKNTCYIPGLDQWGACAGCGIMRNKAQASLFPCPLCLHKDKMTPAQWAKVKEKAAAHQASVLDSL
jgi:hypothetical protein